MLMMHGRFEEAPGDSSGFIAGQQILKLCLLMSFLWRLIDMWHLNQYCLLLPSNKDCANYCFSGFPYWCEIKGLQLLLFELGCVDWRRYMFWMLDSGKHCIHVMDDQFSTVSLWRLTLFLVLAVVILVSLNLHSSIISVVELECCGEKIWQMMKLRPTKTSFS